jgi:hypothetical protein
MVIALWIGRMLARRAPGRELSACVAYGAFGSILFFALMFFVPSGLGRSELLWLFLGNAVEWLPAVLVGAMRGRRTNGPTRVSL